MTNGACHISHWADVDECDENTFYCPPYSDCQNKQAGYNCICKNGYKMEYEECRGKLR